MALKFRRWMVVAQVLTGLLLVARPAVAEGWKAGVASEAITPDRPIWMAGYAARKSPSEGADQDLWVKALALEDPAGKKAVILTLDLVGIDRDTSLAVRQGIEARHGIPLERLTIATSHTHSGPVAGRTLITMYPLDAAQRARIDEYTKDLEAKAGRAADRALAALAPAALAFDAGRADFAVNRRDNRAPDVPRLRAEISLVGPVDHDVPVLRVRGSDGKLVAIVFGYACHCTTLAHNRLNGDYAGYAQAALRKAFPGAEALFVAGCGADQNPIPRGETAQAVAYGDQLAEAVRHVVEGPMRPLDGPLTARYVEVPLHFGTLPTRAQLEKEAASPDLAFRQRAKALLAQLERDGSLPATYPYPVQTWRIGTLTWVLLGGEVVVDYSHRLKLNLGASHTWVSAYCNDVMAYIPSARVLKEGGYEGGGAMVYYGQPASWSDAVENQVIGTVTKQLASSAAGDLWPAK